MEKKILPEFLMLQLESVKYKYGFDRGLRASLKNMKTITIELPINEENDFDINIQKEVTAKYQIIQNLKSKVKAYKKQVEGLAVEVSLKEIRTKRIVPSDLFNSLSIPKRIYKKDIKLKGETPVYSSQISNKGIVGYSNIVMFDATKKPLITFGDHTRAFFIRHEKFAVLDNVKVLELKRPYMDLIDINYVIQQWASNIFNLGYSRHWKEAKRTEILIPTKKNGKFDVAKQEEIALKYQKVEDIKKRISEELDKILNVDIAYE